MRFSGLLNVQFLLVLSSLLLSSGLFGESLQYEGRSGLPGNGKHIVLVSGDEEYRSEETVVQLARILAEHHGFDCTILFAINPETGEIDPLYRTNIPGLDALETANVLLLDLRFRDLPDEQMQRIDDFLTAGKPIFGIRTSTHAFQIPQDKKFARYSFNYDDQGGPWQQGFGRLVLGETWIDHHGHHGHEATRGLIVPEQKNHPVVRGCEDIFGPTDVYRVRLPLPGDSTPLVLGQVLAGMKSTDPAISGPKNDPMMPIAWTKTYQIPGGKSGQVFTSTIGSSQDFANEGVRRLFVNAVYWLAGLEKAIPDQADVAIVGHFEPLPMGFGKFQKGKRPEDFRWTSTR